MQDTKVWYRSTTFWSAVLTAAGVFAPRYATAISQTIGDVGAIAGLVGVVIGRFRPNIKPLSLFSSKE